MTLITTHRVYRVAKEAVLDVLLPVQKRRSSRDRVQQPGTAESGNEVPWARPVREKVSVTDLIQASAGRLQPTITGQACRLGEPPACALNSALPAGWHICKAAQEKAKRAGRYGRGTTLRPLQVGQGLICEDHRHSLRPIDGRRTIQPQALKGASWSRSEPDYTAAGAHAGTASSRAVASIAALSKMLLLLGDVVYCATLGSALAQGAVSGRQAEFLMLALYTQVRS